LKKFIAVIILLLVLILFLIFLVYKMVTENGIIDVLRNEIVSQITPELEGEFIDKANNLTRAGNYREALKYYDAVIKTNPRNARAYYNRSAVKIRIRDYKGAVEDASASIEISPSFYAYQNKIAANQRLKEWQSALDDINVYISNNWPNKEKFYYQKGRCLMKLKSYNEAVKVFDEYEQAVPQRYKASLYKNRAYCYGMLGDIEKSKTDYAKAKNLGSKKAEDILEN